jgi:hypothetical protein
MTVSKDGFKNYIGLDSSDYDSVIDLLVAGAISFAGNYCNNKMEDGDVEEFFDGDSAEDELMLGNTLNVRNVKVSYKADDWVELDSNEYEFYQDTVSVKIKYPIYGLRNYKVNYKAGFEQDKWPADLTIAVLKITGKLWNKRKSDGIRLEKFADAEVDWDSFITDDISKILEKYKAYHL